MPQCVVESRREARRAADAIEADPRVVRPVAVLSPSEGQRDRWTLDIVVRTDDRLDLPDDIYQLVTDQGFGVRRAVPHGPDHHHVAAVARR